MAPATRPSKKSGARKPEEVAADVARDILGELINRALYGSERFVFTRHGKRAAALVSIRDLDALEESEAA